MIQTFVWGIICLFTLLVIREITPIPIVMEAWEGKNIRKCFLSVPVIHDLSNLPHVSSSIPIHTSLLSADHPRILRPPNNRQAQGHYVTDEQCIHIPANMTTHDEIFDYNSNSILMMYKGCSKSWQDKHNEAVGIHFCTFYIFFRAYIPNGSHHILFMLYNY